MRRIKRRKKRRGEGGIFWTMEPVGDYFI